jgi:hypothetical protein
MKTPERVRENAYQRRLAVAIVCCLGRGEEVSYSKHEMSFLVYTNLRIDDSFVGLEKET